MKEMSSETEHALTRRDIDELKLSIADIKSDIQHGFTGVHQRQDKTNGQVQRNKEGIAEMESEFKYNRVIWYLFTAAVGLIIFLATK